MPDVPGGSQMAIAPSGSSGSGAGEVGGGGNQEVSKQPVCAYEMVNIPSKTSSLYSRPPGVGRAGRRGQAMS